MDDRLRTEEGTWQPPKYALSVLIYAERDDRILLLKRSSERAMGGGWFLPGAAVDPGEPPEAAAVRGLREASGLGVAEAPVPVGCYYAQEYGHDFLHLSYRAPVRDGDVVTDDEHEDATWVNPLDMRRAMSDEAVAGMAEDQRTEAMLRGIRDDLDRYLRQRGLDRDAP